MISPLFIIPSKKQGYVLKATPSKLRLRSYAFNSVAPWRSRSGHTRQNGYHLTEKSINMWLCLHNMAGEVQ